MKHSVGEYTLPWLKEPSLVIVKCTNKNDFCFFMDFKEFSLVIGKSLESFIENWLKIHKKSSYMAKWKRKVKPFSKSYHSVKVKILQVHSYYILIVIIILMYRSEDYTCHCTAVSFTTATRTD